MVQTLDLTGVFNVECKVNFLEKYDNFNTKKAFIRIFRNTYSIEEDLNKDLCLFTRVELEEFFENTSPSTNVSARNYGRLVGHYLQWAVEENIISEHPFPVQQNYFLKYVKRDYDIFIDLKELNYYTNMYFENLQDAIILELLFLGVQGKEGSEICNLTISDLDEENHSMKLYDSTTERRRTIYFEDNRLIKLCKRANKEDRYEKRNGEIEYNPRIRPYTELVMDTDYILKNSKTNTVHDGQVTKYTIYNRLKNIQKFAQIEPYKQKITVKNIVKSGQLYMASKLYEKEGELGLPQIRKICGHFGVKESWPLRDHLNEENLFKLYPHLKGK